VSPQVKPPDRAARLKARMRGQRLRQCAEPQRHVVGQLVDSLVPSSISNRIDVFGPAAPQMRCLVEAEISLAHEVFGEFRSDLDQPPADFMAERERPRQCFGQWPFRICRSVPQTPQAPNLDQRAFFGIFGHGRCE